MWKCDECGNVRMYNIGFPMERFLSVKHGLSNIEFFRRLWIQQYLSSHIQHLTTACKCRCLVWERGICMEKKQSRQYSTRWKLAIDYLIQQRCTTMKKKSEMQL